MTTQYHIGLLGKEPMAIKLYWSRAAEETCYQALQKTDPVFLTKHRPPKDPTPVPMDYQTARQRKGRALDQAIASQLTTYLAPKLPPDSLQEILGHAKPQGLFVHNVRLGADGTSITAALVAVSYPQEPGAEKKPRDVMLAL